MRVTRVLTSAMLVVWAALVFGCGIRPPTTEKKPTTPVRCSYQNGELLVTNTSDKHLHDVVVMNVTPTVDYDGPAREAFADKILTIDPHKTASIPFNPGLTWKHTNGMIFANVRVTAMGFEWAPRITPVLVGTVR